MRYSLVYLIMFIFTIISCKNDDSKIEKLEQKLEQQAEETQRQKDEMQRQKQEALQNELNAKNEELERLKSQQSKTSSNANNQNFDYYAKGYGLYPEGSKRLLNYQDVTNLTKRQLKIMRNEIFARHGYIFTTNDMIQYFSGQSWYRPLHKDVSNKLTYIEKENVKYIKSFE